MIRMMKSPKFHILFTLVMLCAFQFTMASAYCQQPPAVQENLRWESWDSLEGLSRLQRSEAKENFWKLVRFYESQKHGTYCSVATSVIALNALSIKPPQSIVLGKYRLFTQDDFFSDQVSSVIQQSDVIERGMSLEELANVLKIFPLNVLKYEACALSHEEMRDLLVTALKNPKQCVLALYQRKVLKQEGGGHWSPLAAYDSASDSFLILDVARFKYPPLWVSATELMNAMQTKNIYDKSRGFIIIESP